ncbi:hypothetical protein [Paenibacillus oleatilyticus]|uniref:Chitinase n=1 Tax=Paenibacillus oleatilyticus TaxID=2594886 RepID=A0ABV4UU49_9BACL
MKWKEPTFGPTPLLKALMGANARRKAQAADLEGEQKKLNLTYPDWAKDWIRKYKEAWYMAEACGDKEGMKRAAKLAEGFRDKLRAMEKMPPWAQEQMQKQTVRWMEANEVGNVREMKAAGEAGQGIRDKLIMIDNLKQKSPDQAKLLDDLTAKWYYANDKNSVPQEDVGRYSNSQEAKADYTKQAQGIIIKHELNKEKEKEKEKAKIPDAKVVDNVLISKEQLELLFKESKHFQAGKVTDEMIINLNTVLRRYIVDGCTDEGKIKMRIRHFLAQCLHESRVGIIEKYNGNPDDYFKNIDGGAKYRGAGYIQLTGKSNYQAFANFMKKQEIVEEGYSFVAKNYAWEAAGFWWRDNDMNANVDNGDSLKQISNAVNRGPKKKNSDLNPNGWVERQNAYKLVCEVIK